jgi:K+-sensing histidine kinase KdpD
MRRTRSSTRNLIENALRYGRHASVQLVSSPSSVDIMVDDEGPGIPSTEIEQVFAPSIAWSNHAAARRAG